MSIPTPDPNSSEWNIYIDNQSFNVTGLNGEPTTLDFPMINAYIYQVAAESVVYAFQLGFAAMLVIVLLLLTSGKKRHQPIFILNLASLVFVCVRSIVDIIVLCASYRGIGQMFLSAEVQYPASTWAPIVIGNILNIFIYAFVLTSLLLQVRVVFAAEPLSRRVFTIIGATAIVAEMGLVIAWEYFATKAPFVGNSFVYPLWIYTTYKIYFVAFVGISCFIFLSKLAIAIYRRRRMGININQLGPLQIIFIMFTHCLVVPRMHSEILSSPQLIFVLVCFYIIDLTITSYAFDNFDLIGQTLLICSLPLSAIWASAEVKEHGLTTHFPGTSDSNESNSQSKFSIFSSSKKSKKSPSDLEKASYTTDGLHLHPPMDYYSDSFSH